MPQTDILLNADGINIHKLKGLQIYRQVFMFWMKDRYRLPAVERFINYMKGSRRKMRMIPKTYQKFI